MIGKRKDGLVDDYFSEELVHYQPFTIFFMMVII